MRMIALSKLVGAVTQAGERTDRLWWFYIPDTLQEDLDSSVLAVMFQTSGTSSTVRVLSCHRLAGHTRPHTTPFLLELDF